MNLQYSTKSIVFLCIRANINVHCRQNRESTEGYSNSIVRKNNDKFGKKIDLNK